MTLDSKLNIRYARKSCSIDVGCDKTNQVLCFLNSIFAERQFSVYSSVLPYTV